MLVFLLLFHSPHVCVCVCLALSLYVWAGGIYLFCAFFTVSHSFFCRSSRKAQLVNDVLSLVRSFAFFVSYSTFLHPHSLFRFYLAKRLLISCIKLVEDTISARTSQYKYTTIYIWYKKSNSRAHTDRNRNEIKKRSRRLN